MTKLSMIFLPGPTIYFLSSYIASEPPLSRLIASIQPNLSMNLGISSIDILPIVPIFTSSVAVRQMNDLVPFTFIFAVISPTASYRGTRFTPLARSIGKFAIPLWSSSIRPEL